MFGLSLQCQTTGETKEGSVSFVTSQNVYVKFNSTENINIGDTLFSKQENKLIPVLTVTNLSSISCVCVRISSVELKVADVLFTKQKPVHSDVQKPVEIVPQIQSQPVEINKDTVQNEGKKSTEIKQEFSGRFSVASYTNFTSNNANNSQRMKYTFSFNLDHINKSKLSAESYISFSHSNLNWNEVQNNLFNGLKIYSLALKYDFSNTSTLWLGRKINPKLSSVGAIDGLQFEKKFNHFSLGAFGGSRPDYTDYSFDFNLIQYGAYVAHETDAGKGSMQNSLAFVEQNNSGQTDRRFFYFQHTNTIVNNLYFFGSAEFDLYNKVKVQTDSINGQAALKQDNSPRLTNLYVSLRYKITRQVSVTASYSTRQNIIYYETYKDFIERLLEKENLQGYRLMINYRPVKYLSIGVKGGYRVRTSDPKPAKDLYSYVTYSRVPLLNVSATLSAMLLESVYISSKIYSFGISRDLIPGKVSAGINYRYVDYSFYTSDLPLIQNVGELDLNWRIIKKLSLSVYYEGTFEKSVTFNRIYANLGYRF